MKRNLLHFYTDDGRDVTEWVSTGRTFIFRCLFEARDKAKEIHSYVYEIHDAFNCRVGWAVPK